jgi:hypothetical protein
MKMLIAVVTALLALLPVSAAGVLFVRYAIVSSCEQCGFPTFRTNYFGRGHCTNECLRCGYIQATPGLRL